MEKTIKELKSLSKFIGFIGAYQIYNLVLYITTVFTAEIVVTDPMQQQLLPVIKALGIVPIALSVLVHLYLCIKGHREANDPSTAKLHIILSIIWTIGYALSAIGTIANFSAGVSVLGVIDALFAIASAVLMFFYSKYAKEVRALEKQKNAYY